MIREHVFNTAWWGEPVGLIEDANFFDLPISEQQAALSPYSWVEFRSPLEGAPISRLDVVGFLQFDTQLIFRISLPRVPSTQGLDDLTLRFAEDSDFRVDAHASAVFAHERYRRLPGISDEKLNERYSRWANDLIHKSPGWCVEVLSGSVPQGWFLSEEDSRGLHLALAMLHRDARVSGTYLFQAAMVAYAKRGAQVGHARFSASNTAVHNIYARLGAIFGQPLGYWLWVPDTR